VSKAPAAPLVRTPGTYLVYATLGFYGWFCYGLGPIVPLLREEQGTSRTVAGLHSTALACGALVAGALYPVLVRRIGRAATAWTMIGSLAGTIVLLVSVPSVPWATLPVVLLAGVTGSGLVSAAAPALRDLHGPAGAALSEANAVATGAGLVAPLAVGAGLALGFGWRPALLVATVLAVGIAVAARSSGTRFPGSVPSRAEPVAVRTPMSRTFWISWAVLFCCVAAEFSSTLWASDVVRVRTGASAAVSAAAVTAIVAGMCAGRIVGARLAVRLPVPRLMLGALAVAVVGAAVFWFSADPLPALAGLAIGGFGLGPLFPLGLDLSMAAAPGQTDRAAGLTTYAAGLAIGGGPFVLGAVADMVGPHTAYLVVPVLFGLAAIGVVLGVVTVRRSAGPEIGGLDAQFSEQPA
jgi:MFS family permease